jgi:serine/threonine-protein kinase
MRRTPEHEIFDAPAGAIDSGVFVDAFRVERVIDTRPDMYTVVEARRPDGEQVALTLLAPELAQDGNVRRSVLGLARLRASVEHPHLVPFHGAVERRNRVYLVSALPSSRTLADLLREGRLGVADTLHLLGQVAGALETAAARGLTHRDLTPSAIVLEEQDDGLRARLTDFAIAVPPAPGCEMLGYGDGANYRSPEEVRGAAPEPASNVYSLTCILVRCVTGTAAYPYAQPLLTLHAQIVEPPPRVSERSPDLPPALDAVVARGMAKDPRERHSSPAHLIRAAGRALDIDVPVPVIAPPPQERMRLPAAPARRGIARKAHRTTAWIGLALCASAVSGFATGGVDWSGEPQTRPTVRYGAAPDRLRHFAYTQQVNTAVERLRGRRVAERTRLREARRPVGQAAAAKALANAYRDARQALAAGPAIPTGKLQLADGLRNAERAYRQLAAAASARRRHAWRIARREALRREGALRRELRQHG